MSFTYNNKRYDMIQVQSDTHIPICRQGAMIINEYIKPNIIGLKEYREDFMNRQYTGYYILCKVNNVLEWVKVDCKKGLEILNNIM